MTPTLAILYAILRQAVMDMAHRPGLTVNSFALVDQMPDLAHPSYGYTYEDYQAGNFWARDWAGAGAFQADLSGQWPVLMPELIGSRVHGRNSIQHSVTLVLVDHLADPHCGPRSGPKVYNNLLRMILAVRAEVNRYELYHSAEHGAVWSTPGRGAGISEDVNLSDYLDWSDEIRPWGDYPHLRGLYASLTLTECIDVDGVAFRYDRSEPASSGVISCRLGCN